MKKVLLMLVAGAFMSASMMSCSKCGHCDYNGTADAKYCQKDSKTVYDAAKSACDLGGGTWKND
jgi:hypothetical protein